MERREEILKNDHVSIDCYVKRIRKMGPFVFLTLITEALFRARMDCWAEPIDKMLKEIENMPSFETIKKIARKQGQEKTDERD